MRSGRINTDRLRFLPPANFRLSSFHCNYPPVWLCTTMSHMLWYDYGQLPWLSNPARSRGVVSFFTARVGRANKE